MGESPLFVETMKEFDWQLSRTTPLTEAALNFLSEKQDHFGEPFQIGDRVLHAMLAESPTACRYRQLLVKLTERSYTKLIEQYHLFGVVSGIPRYVRNKQ